MDDEDFSIVTAGGRQCFCYPESGDAISLYKVNPTTLEVGDEITASTTGITSYSNSGNSYSMINYEFAISECSSSWQ